MNKIKGYYLMPHPPIMISEVGRGEEKKIQSTIEACLSIGKEISELKPEVIIIISPHGVMFSDAIALLNGDRIVGDLGRFRAPEVNFNLEIDKELTDEILKISEEKNIDTIGLNTSSLRRYSRAYELDHGAMVPLYSINKFYSKYKLVHITYGFLSDLDLYQFGVSIKEAVEKLNRSAVVIASGDLSHRLSNEGPYSYSPMGKIFDQTFLRGLENGDLIDVFKLDKKVSEEAGECGMRSVYILLGSINSSFMGKLLSYEGPFGVGYGVMKFIPTDEITDYFHLLKEALNQAKQEKITNSNEFVKLARKSIEYYFEHGTLMGLPSNLSEKLKEEQAGVFVSLHKYGNLRGCIGTFLPTQDSIGEEIIHNAIEAATRDPRFPPVSKNELEDIEISVDVLSTPEPTNQSDLNPKKYGVIVHQNYKRGLLLPDLEGVDTVKYQLEIACKKAGINPNSKYEIERFTVTRYHEGEQNA